jgi:hypothetical protein
MKIARIAAWGAGVALLCAMLLPGQTVVEAAKKEKERREALKGKQGEVVTNADLVRTKKKPAVIQPDSGGAPPAEKPNRPADAAASAPPAIQPVPTDLRAEQAKLFDEGKLEIENRLKAAQELIDLLKLKMTALQQQLYNFSNTTSRDQIQRDISETYQKLQAAVGEETKIKDELDKFVAAGPAALTPIR